MGLLDWFQGNPLIQQIAQSGRRNREIIGTLLDRPDLPQQERQALLSEMSQSKMASPFMGFGVGNIKAYHGSPHDFARFSTQNIGTGEGAQAYGHGLYFAENPKVAQIYQEALRPMTEVQDLRIGGIPVWRRGSPVDYSPHQFTNKPGIRDYVRAKFQEDLLIDEWRLRDAFDKHGIEGVKRIARENLESSIKEAELNWPEAVPQLKHIMKRLEAGANSVDFRRGQSHLYEVNIKPDPPDFLDWDKPLSQQSEKVRKALENIKGIDWSGVSGDEASLFKRAIDAGMDKKSASEYAKSQAFESTGAHLLAALGRDSPRTSNILRQAGIRGIRYKDAGSRGSEKGTYNYVVFDENDVEILSKK